MMTLVRLSDWNLTNLMAIPFKIQHVYLSWMIKLIQNPKDIATFHLTSPFHHLLPPFVLSMFYSKGRNKLNCQRLLHFLPGLRIHTCNESRCQTLGWSSHGHIGRGPIRALPHQMTNDSKRGMFPTLRHHTLFGPFLSRKLVMWWCDEIGEGSTHYRIMSTVLAWTQETTSISRKGYWYMDRHGWIWMDMPLILGWTILVC